MPTNLQPARRGQFTTRNSRRVDILDSVQVQEPIPGDREGRTLTKTVWNGILYAANGKDVDSRHQWEDDGRQRNPKGVASQFDLAIFVKDLPPDGWTDEPIHTTTQEAPAPLSAAPEPPAPFVPHPAVAPHLPKMIADLYGHLVQLAAEVGLDVLERDPQITGPWAQVISDTIEALLDAPKRKSVESAAVDAVEQETKPDTYDPLKPSTPHTEPASNPAMPMSSPRS